MKQFDFVPGYYEWLLVDTQSNKTIFSIEDPLEDIYNFKTKEEIKNYVVDVVEAWENNDYPQNGIVYQNQNITDNMIDLMATTLYDTYIA